MPSFVLLNQNTTVLSVTIFNWLKAPPDKDPDLSPQLG